MIDGYVKAHGGWVLLASATLIALITVNAGTAAVAIPIIGEAAVVGLLPILLVPLVSRSCFDAMGTIASLPGRRTLAADLIWVGALTAPILVAAYAAAGPIDSTTSFAAVAAVTMLVSRWVSLTAAGASGIATAFGLFLFIGSAMRQEAGFWGDWWRGSLPCQLPIALVALGISAFVGLSTRSRHGRGFPQ